MSYLNESLATKAISAFSEILRLSTIEVIFAYFGRIVENIKENRHGYLSINIASQFLRLFFNKENWTREGLVDKL